MRTTRKLKGQTAVRNCVETLESRILLSTYYVSTTGSDTNNGTSTSTPWATLTKVDATTFQPGDQILFQRGDEWHGLLIASASGNASNPIVYGAYGTGTDPIFDGSDVIAPSAFTAVSGNEYSFQVSATPTDTVYWVYANHTELAAAGSQSDVTSTAGTFFINGNTVYINTGGPNPITAPSSGSNAYLVTAGDRGAGTNANSSLIDSNGFNYITFENLWGRETAEVGSGNSLNGISDGYVIRVQGGSNITLLDDEFDNGSKHNVGAIDTNNFLANGVVSQGAPVGTSDNQLPYGNATAFVCYADNGGHNTFTLINCTVENYSGSQPAFLTHEVNSGDITSITLTNFIANGAPIALEPGSNETITFNGGEVINNTLTAYGATGTPILINGMTFTGSQSAVEIYGDATVQNCLFEGSSQSNQAIQVSGAGNIIRFNTIDAASQATAIALESGETGAAIYGNIFTGTTNDISVAGNDTFTANYDVYDSTAGSPQFNLPGGNVSFSTFKSDGYEANGLDTNPQFVGSGANPYSLQSTSPAINLVPTTGISGITTDILGNPRPSGSGYDAGAYEFQIAQYPPTVQNAAAANPNPVTGTTTALSVLGADQSGESNLTYTWSVGGTPPGNVTFSSNGTNAAKNTTATFTAAGDYDIIATIVDGQYSITSNVTVDVNQTATSVVVTPPTPYVAVNTTKQFSATVDDQFGNPIANSPITWSSTGLGSINSSGLYTAPTSGSGSATVKATSGSINGTTTVTVTPPDQAPTVATAASANPNPVTNDTTALSVLGASSLGESNLTYTWSLVGTPPASVTYSANGTNAAKNTNVLFSTNGSYNFLVTITDPEGLSTTSSVTVTVNTINPVTVDGSLDSEYGSPIVLQQQATNFGNSTYTGPGGNGASVRPYSQLSAAYGIIDESNNTFNLFLAGSVDLNNAALDLLLSSPSGAGVSNLSGVTGYGSSFTGISFDTGFTPSYLFDFQGGGGQYLTYTNLNTDGNQTTIFSQDPQNGIVNDSANSSIPYFTLAVNNAVDGTVIQPANAASVTTGFEISFSLSGLGYTLADYQAGDPINVLAMITYGSHTVATNQFLGPYLPQQSYLNQDAGTYTYLSTTNFALGNQSKFPGNQFFSVNVPQPSQPTPVITSAASANPNPATGSTSLTVSATISNSASLTYTWSLVGTPPGPVNYSSNGTTTSNDVTATFADPGTYNFLVTVSDGSEDTTSSVTVTVNGSIGVATPASGVVAANGKSAALSVLGSDPAGESNLTYTWTVTSVPNGNAPSPVFSANKTNAAKNTTATFFQAGSYTFLVTLTDTSGNTTTSSVVVIVPQIVAEMYIQPANANLSINSNQQYSVSPVYDQFYNPILTPSVTWAITSGGGTFSSSGVLTPANDGTFTVTATSGSYVASTQVTISGTLSTIASPPPSTGTTPPTTTTSTTTTGTTSGSGSTTTTTTGTTTTGTTTPTHKKTTPKKPKPTPVKPKKEIKLVESHDKPKKN